VPTAAGFLYLAIVLDAFSRRIVGWAMANHLRSELVLDALEMAVTRRRLRNVIHHSDQGSQYTSLAFGSRCQEAGVRSSIGSVGDAYDNAMAESFFSTLECELLARRRFRSWAEARMACFSYIEGFYNSLRRHSALGTRHSDTARPSSTSRQPNQTRHLRCYSTKPPEPSTETGQSQLRPASATPSLSAGKSPQQIFEYALLDPAPEPTIEGAPGKKGHRQCLRYVPNPHVLDYRCLHFVSWRRP